jgi:hypothetical protein
MGTLNVGSERQCGQDNGVFLKIGGIRAAVMKIVLRLRSPKAPHANA